MNAFPPPTPLDYAKRTGIRERIGDVTASAVGGRGVKSADIAQFYRLLATQLDAGIDMRRSIATLAGQVTGRFADVLSDLLRRVREGDSLADALADHEALFGVADVAALRAAERAGVMEEALGQLADRRESAARLRKAATSALAYPAVVLSIALVVTLLLFAFVVPTILGPIREANRALPLPTVIVSGISTLLISYGWLLILLAVAGFFLGRYWLRKASGKRSFDIITGSIPVVGPLLQKHALAQSLVLLATCVRCGLNLIESIGLAAEACRNTQIADALARWHASVDAGDDPAEAIRHAGTLPPLMIETVDVGTTTGTLDTALLRLAKRYEADVDDTAKRLGSLIEPAIVVILGGVVLLIALAVLLPVLQLGDVFSS